MSFSKVSVLVPTRRRPKYLRNFLESYEKTVGGSDKAELVFRCDNDDIESVKQLSFYSWPIIVGPRREGYKSLPSFYNDMLKLATGDLFVCGNDDMVFETKNWPEILIEEANKFPDGIFNIGVATGLNDDKFPFSVVSRKLAEAMGKINDERLLFSDIFLLDVAKHFGRAVRINSVAFRHDWAGFGDDQTRREANVHEFVQVFANDKGDWTDQYRELQDKVVAEAIGKIDANGEFLAGDTIRRFEQYVPVESMANQQWPPRIPLTGWANEGGFGSIHYGRQESFELLRVISKAGIRRQCAVLSGSHNGLPSLLWGHFCDKVVTVFERPQPEGMRPMDHKHIFAYGPVAHTRFLYQLLDQAPTIDVLVLDSTRYANLISPYYLLKKAISKPGMIVFVNTNPRNGSSNDGALRFVADLQSGHLDGVQHDIHDVLPQDGAGFSYELVR
jgi:hypothetical protein